MDPDNTDMGAMSSLMKKICLSSSSKQRKRNTTKVPIGRDETHYKMTHKKRGYALILNHIYFDPRLKKDCRAPGTNEDARRLQKTFGRLGFQVITRDDEKLTVKTVQSTLKELSRKDFSDCDCLIVVVLSHGEMNKIFAYDDWYPIDLLAENFTPDKCRGLAGKPKIFVLNLCQGKKRDVGVHTQIETDVGDENGNIVPNELLTPYRLPLYADFLYAYSTVPRFVSYRDPDGSWYVKTLCEVFDQYATNTEITALLTFVNRRVAVNFETADYELNYPHLKQMPCFTTMLTRLLVFQPKK